jgi:hypothetical protein
VRRKGEERERYLEGEREKPDSKVGNEKEKKEKIPEGRLACFSKRDELVSGGLEVNSSWTNEIINTAVKGGKGE